MPASSLRLNGRTRSKLLDELLVTQMPPAANASFGSSVQTRRRVRWEVRSKKNSRSGGQEFNLYSTDSHLLSFHSPYLLAESQLSACCSKLSACHSSFATPMAVR